ncbi:MAG TPA: amidohydrolase family protein [Acidimicrobiales bacterium]|nr:amidohydrolase family protein [Acidimicrobiales bacterium]
MTARGEETTPDILVTRGSVVTMNAEREILDHGAVAIAGDTIVAVGPSGSLEQRWPLVDRLDAGGGLITPGLINAHQHVTGDPLVWSSIPDTLPPGESIFGWALPLHAAEGPTDERFGAALVAAASVRNGVTTLIEPGTVVDPDAVAEGLASVGIRAGIGVWAWDADKGPLASSAAQALENIAAVLDRYPAGGAIEGWVTLIGHNLASDELLVGAAELTRARGARMTMHLSPTSSDPVSYLEVHGVRPFVHLQRLGVLGPHLLVAHGVWIDDEEFEAILGSRTALAYCPWAYLRLGQGVTGHGRHAELYRSGGRVALGCDACNAGDMPDVLRSAALAAGLAKDQREDPTWFAPHDAFEMATISGAEAIGLGDRVGSLEVGKQADVVVFEAAGPQWASPGDPIQKLVWSSDGRDVRHVFVGGKRVVKDRQCTLIDEVELVTEARQASAALIKRAGLEPPTRWPVRKEPPEL